MNRNRDDLIQLVGQTPLYTLVGPPGTGKTTRLTKMVSDAVDRGWQVLIASLTKTAAREVAGRQLPIHEHRIGTLHSHAYRALGGGLNIAEGKDGLVSWADWVSEHDLPNGWQLSGGAAPSPDEPKDGPGAVEERTDGDELYEQIGIWRSRLTPPDVWPLSHQAFFKAWREWKYESNFTDFEDLIERCALEDVAPEFEVDALYVDEAQDLSASEVRLCATWARRTRAFVVVGDPRQCLYEWRGSDPELFGDLIHASKKTDVLRQSYRVPRAVHGAAAEWVEQLHDGIDATYLPTDAAGGLERTGLNLRRAELLAAEIEDVAKSGQTVMTLASCSYLLRPMIAALRDRGIPFHNPYRTKRGDWNPLRQPESPTSAAGRLVAFSRVDVDTWGAEARFWTPKEIHGWADALPADMFVRGGKTAIKRASGKDGAGMSPEDLEALVPSREALEAMFYGDLAWYRDHMVPKAAKGSAFALAVADKSGVRSFFATPKVITGTCHSVKGGEADRVYLWPDLSPSGYDDWCSAATRGQNVRTFYVGMTRAKQSLVLCGPSSARAVTW